MKPLGNFKHGGHGTLTYARWKSMRQRCAKHSGHYAAIECCARWESFIDFLTDMGECPEGHTLDRIDNQIGYEPGNCRWATREQQNQNRSQCVFLTHNNETKIVSQWAHELGISAFTIRSRLRNGWSIERTLTAKVGKQGARK